MKQVFNNGSKHSTRKTTVVAAFGFKYVKDYPVYIPNTQSIDKVAVVNYIREELLKMTPEQLLGMMETCEMYVVNTPNIKAIGGIV